MKGKLLLVACFVLVFLVACGDNETSDIETRGQTDVIASTEEIEPTDTPDPTNTPTPKPTDTPVPEPTATTVPTNTPIPVPTNTPKPTATPEPTFTPTATSTPEPTPALSFVDLQDKWRTPLDTTVITFGAYQGLHETAVKLQNEEIDGITATGVLFGNGILLKAAEDMLQEWQPLPDQAEFKAKLQTNIDAVQHVIGRWLDKEITSSDVPEIIAQDKAISESLLTSLKEAMIADGLTQGQIDAMMDDFLQRLESFGESTGEN